MFVVYNTIVLTLGAHALQGYSSWVCVCPVQFFHTVMNDMQSKRALFIKQPLCIATSVLTLGAPGSHFACPHWCTSVYLILLHCTRPRGIVVDSFAIVFVQHYIAHACISLGVDLELHVVFITWRKVYMSSAQYSMCLKKVAEALAL